MGTCLQEAFPAGDDGSSSAFNFDSVRRETDAGGMEHLLRALDHERQRLGQELHDSAGQLVACLQLSIARLEIEDPEHGPLIREIQDITSEIGHEIRSLSFLHYPVELADRGLAAAIEILTRGFTSRTSIRTSFALCGDVAPLGEDGALALLRVAQEALVNVYRHAHAASAVVLLRRRKQSVELTVRDDGVGLCQQPGKSYGIGLQSMRHRVETLGGVFRVSNLRHGVKIFASVPITA